MYWLDVGISRLKKLKHVPTARRPIIKLNSTFKLELNNNNINYYYSYD